MANVLIAGGTGFIGSHLTQRLNDEGHTVKVLSLHRKYPLYGQWEKNVELIHADLRDRETVLTALKGFKFESVFNLSGYIDQRPFFEGGREVMDQHWLGTINLIEALNRDSLRSFIQIGSSDEYGNAPSPQNENMRETPLAPYSLGKVAANHLIQHLYRKDSFPGTILRLFLVYGPGQDDRRFLPQIINGCLENKSFKTSEGKQIRDFCFVDDIVQGMV